MNADFIILRVASERHDAQNERDGAGLRSSVAAATPSQLRRSSAARTMSGRRGIVTPSRHTIMTISKRDPSLTFL